MGDRSPEFSDKFLQDHAEAFDRIVLRWSWTERRRLAGELAAFRLSIPQYMAMVVINRQNGNCAMHTLAEAAQETSATMTGIVDRLVEHGFVERHRDPSDRRSVLVSLTGSGERVMEEVETRRHVLMRHILKNLSPPDREEMLRLLRLYLQAMTAETNVEG
jgi:DNA-binding MarR family transcriptional regulator